MQSTICLGVVTGPHGVRGDVRVKSFTDDPCALGAYGPLGTGDGRTLIVKTARPARGGARVHFEGIDDRTQAETLTGAQLHVARAALPELPSEQTEDDFYHADLIGLTAVDEAGAVVGTVAGVHNFGAGDLLDIGGEFLPFTRACVPHVDLAAGKLTIRTPPQSDTPDKEAAS